jgi:hypothetical protein
MELRLKTFGMETVIVLRASFFALLFFFFSIGWAVACDPNEDCSPRCLVSAFGACVQRGNDPTCEARKSACRALAEKDKASAAAASKLGEPARPVAPVPSERSLSPPDGVSRQAPSLPSLQDDFLRYDYAETKDLSKSFLTLVSAILVFSITFSEKIVDFPNAGRLARICLIISWSLFMLSIILCGVSLCLISLAGGNALYGGDYLSLAFQAWTSLLVAGTFFAIGLLTLIVAATASLSKRPTKDINEQKADLPKVSLPSEVIPDA